MNPLRWKREHQLALVVAALIGLIVGEVVGFALTGAGERFGAWLEESFWYHYITFGGFMWGIFGAIIGAAIVYTANLIRQ